jgi:competence protein ComEA
MRIASLLVSAAIAALGPALGVHAAKPAKAVAPAPAASGAVLPASAAAQAASGAASAAAPTARVDINTASAQLLVQVLDIDTKTAQAIIKARPYETADDLVTRMVLSNKDFKLIKDRVVVGPAGKKP